MELRELKGVYHALFRSLLEEEQFRDYPHFGIIIQSYLREAREDVENLLEWARRGERRFAVRLVKGAYRETEIVHAGRNSWSQPVLAAKTDTDAAYESLARLLLSGYPRVRLACASHNPRTIASVLELGREAKVPLKELEFQLIYGMADSLQSALVKMGLPVRVYTPFGGLVPGLGYLIRRLLEVGGRDSFLRDRFFEGREIDELVGPPDGTGDHASSAVSAAIAPVVPPLAGRALPPFANEPTLDWSREREREAMARALVRTREALPYRLAPVIGGQEVRAERSIHSTDPNDPARTIGVVSAAGREEALAAIRAAREAFAGWRRVPPAERADTLFRAAVAARELRYDLAALEVLEVGRSWSEADGDVCEAIDYLEYYGREMLRLAKPRRTAEVRGEVSHLLWEPAGVAAVIAPWNFPLAISMGMVSAALVTGSTVVYKPSSASPVVGSMILRVFERAGLPAGVLNFLPGSGGELGDVLVGAPEVALAAFTGSKEVGLHLIETAHRASEGSRQVTRVVCEMGGKNAAIVDTDAELDEAVREIVQSAFGYQGQKCSACSRLIVLEGIYDRLIARLVAATESLAMGPAEDPASFVGAVIDSAAREKILQYIEIGRHEAHLLLHREPPPGRGHTVPLAVFGEVLPHHRIAREEIFGPVLAVIRVGDFEEALAVANDSEYALTGSVFSRSPAHIEWARRELRVGSLYINRRCTGAIVGRHPFGGFRMSGVGTKAGGPDYLQQFMLSRTVVENTLRRGFAPE
jgi:RHH-type proline utilization regulon transcriptional repressor/proline dehydrogenase/delta 1-pyrroline-5-carboxylate dehydrogenase